MAIERNQPDQAKLHHNAWRERRRRLRPHHFLEQLPSWQRRIDLELELGGAAHVHAVPTMPETTNRIIKSRSARTLAARGRAWCHAIPPIASAMSTSGDNCQTSS
jgi:hypothetical protein